MIAFWRYDLYPYLLGGKVVKTHTGGDPVYVETEEYGIGMRFKPQFVLADEPGLELLKRLKWLEGQYKHLEELLHKEYQEKAASAIAQAKMWQLVTTPGPSWPKRDPMG